MTKLIAVRTELNRQFKAFISPGTGFWEEAMSTLQGEKKIRGPHIIVYLSDEPTSALKRKIYTLFAKLFSDVPPRKNFPCRWCSYGGQPLWTFSFDVVVPE